MAAFSWLHHETTGQGLTMMSLVWLLLLLDSVSATHWTVTSYFALSITTVTYFNYDSSPTVYTRTRIQTVKPDATITAAALSTSSSTYSYDDLEVVKVWLPPNAVGPSDIQTTLIRESYDPNAERRYTYYVQPICYTAPKSCPTPFTVTTSTTVNVPNAVVSQVTATATSTSVYIDSDGDAYTQVTSYLNQTHWPSASDLSNAYLYSRYVARCENPAATTTSKSRCSASDRNNDGSPGRDGGSDDGSSDGHQSCRLEHNCDQLATWAIVLAVVLPAVFILGFVESFFWFSRLMTGEATIRFGTLCWLLLCCPIIFLSRRVPSRSIDDRARLRQQWKDMGVGRRISLWFKLGLRHTYPVELLGDHPNCKTDGWAEEQQMQSQASNILVFGQQPSQSQTQHRPADQGATVPQTQRRSSQRMPTIHEQSRASLPAGLSGQTSP